MLECLSNRNYNAIQGLTNITSGTLVVCWWYATGGGFENKTKRTNTLAYNRKRWIIQRIVFHFWTLVKNKKKIICDRIDGELDDYFSSFFNVGVVNDVFLSTFQNELFCLCFCLLSYHLISLLHDIPTRWPMLQSAAETATAAYSPTRLSHDRKLLSTSKAQ